MMKDGLFRMLCKRTDDFNTCVFVAIQPFFFFSYTFYSVCSNDKSENAKLNWTIDWFFFCSASNQTFYLLLLMNYL